jgi:HAE1 family hydrophobic/amphiphilic exporter-1
MDTLNILIGSTYEQGFILFNQFYKVYVQALPEFRRFSADLDNLFVKNDRGEMVPYSAFMTIKKQQGLNEITRYNLYPSAAIQGAPASGYSSGQAIQAIQEVAAQTLPRGYGLGWEGLSYDESKKGNEAVYIFLIVVAFVYLVLVGQYESFLLPLAVILSLPVGLFGSFLFLQAMGLANDVYAQIGLVMLVGLLGKNAILIVEFAVQRRREGVPLHVAAVEGGKLRFRPIQMTSFAFIAGLIPLVVATGAGAIGNRTIGTTGVGGMLVGTVLGVLVIPGLYYLFGRIADGRKILKDETDEPLSETVEVKRETENFIKREVKRVFKRMKRELTLAIDKPSTYGEMHTSPPEDRPQEATTKIQPEAENQIANALVAISISGSDLITANDPSTGVEQAKEKNARTHWADDACE